MMASAQHSSPHKRHILPRREARLVHRVLYNSFSTKFYRRTRMAAHSMFASVELQNTGVSLASPTRLPAIFRQHLVTLLLVCLCQGRPSHFSPHRCTCHRSTTPGLSTLVKSILSF